MTKKRRASESEPIASLLTSDPPEKVVLPPKIGVVAVRFRAPVSELTGEPGPIECGVSRFLDSLVMRPGSHVLFVVPMLVLGFGIPARSGDGSGCRRLRCTQRLYGGQGLD